VKLLGYFFQLRTIHVSFTAEIAANGGDLTMRHHVVVCRDQCFFSVRISATRTERRSINDWNQPAPVSGM